LGNAIALPRMSSVREIRPSEERKLPWEYRYDKKQRRSVHKTVQTWIDDIRYIEKPQYRRASSLKEPIRYEFSPPSGDVNAYTIEQETMYQISKRVELATHFNVTARYASTRYQATSYGLAGFVEPHYDPWGYNSDEVHITEERKTLITDGDYIATFMGWLNSVKSGGCTVFPFNENVDKFEPQRGSAGFWINLYSCHKRDKKMLHGGCPVKCGTKFILNKWINSFNQYKKWPCSLSEHVHFNPLKGNQKINIHT